MASRSVVIKLGTSTLTAGTDALNLPFRDSAFDAEELSERMRAVGFSGVQHHTGYCRHHTGYCRHHRLMFGTVVIHWGWK